ncbi:acylphosphatase [Bacillus canaveralius]|uniref:acylphosphatase n=1 Tax=Bacillus canaveralius TaxID=1403243 RepID=A0A2N5GFK4_9BACI|nr:MULTISPECIES: acylphosphatase [Bacillus]PLR79523.1 acylphosphatase [Bacillus canaveralius]PLR87069.1 acylphosphatase [Bacillus sp. V33-4]PLR94924.1 acylphosphatase [Bacillus canaveralius]RSK50662.1 acylphosphatase [Bacillus canaveralius]
MLQYHLIVNGRVHGVGFRYFTQMKANAYHITGWVRNLPDDQVEILAEGSEDDLVLFANSIKEGNPFSRVTSIEKTESSHLQGFKSFTIKY